MLILMLFILLAKLLIQLKFPPMVIRVTLHQLNVLTIVRLLKVIVVICVKGRRRVASRIL